MVATGLGLPAGRGALRLEVSSTTAGDRPLHLPLQGLDYWSRVRWHHQRGEFQKFGYFAGRELSPRDPVLLLVAPALRIHPTTDQVLQYLSPEIDWTLLAIDERWRRLENANRADDPAAFEPVLALVEENLKRELENGEVDAHRLAQAIRRTVGKWVSDTYRRRPMIIPTVLEV